jgi:hypothetical protein
MRIRGPGLAAIKNAVGGYLTGQEIEAVLARRELLLSEIDAEIARRGEKSVLY